MNRDIRAIDPDKVNAVRLQILLQQGFTAIITNLVISTITAFMMWSVVSDRFVVVWISVASGVNISRIALWHWAHRQTLGDVATVALQRCENIYALGLFISGSVWGSLAFIYSPELPMTQQMAIPLIMAGMSAGAVFTYLNSIRSFSAFVLPMILPITVSLFVADLNALALCTLVYLIVITIQAASLNKKMTDSLALRLENQSLVDHLSSVNQSQSRLLDELQAKETFLTHTFEDAGVPMLLMDSHFLIFDVNKAGCALLDYDKASLKGLKVTQLLSPEESDELSPQSKRLVKGEIDQYRITRRCISRHGKTLWLDATFSAVRNEHGAIEYVVIQAQDITEQYLLSRDLNHLASHDSLTGLPNRRALEKRLKELLSQPDDTRHVFCYVDLDQFKVINDTCGHIAGDALLKQISSLLRNHLRQHDMLAHFSGDEFAILMADRDVNTAVKDVEQLMEKIRGFHFQFEGHTFRVSACIGVVGVNHHSSLVDLLKQADSACYAAKEAGRDRLHVFTETDTELLQRSGEMRWVSRIQQALRDNQMVLFSQPIVPTQAKKAEKPHHEILIRMRDADGSIISPGEFLPAAERYNLAAAIDMWTVENVLSRLAAAREAGRAIRGIYAINLSGQSLGDTRFYEKIIELITRADLNQHGAVICFEITETAAITNIRSALRFINELRKVGCLFALDDFGSGLSSFAYLKQLPIDYLKIDGIFVKDCVNNNVNLEIVNSINGIGQVLGLKTVAEFVADEATYISMKQLGVDFVQGFLLAKPAPWEI
jgi:Amt family ammonium transporter